MIQDTESNKSVNPSRPETIVINTGINVNALTEYLVERELERREKAKLPKVTLNTMYRAATAAVAQGVWTPISYFAETDEVGALKVANELGCSVTSIHEFDWERFVEVYGSKAEFKRLHASGATSIKVAQLAKGFVDDYLKKRPEFRGELSSKDETETHCHCITLGSSLALGMIAKIDRNTATDISDIVCADF